MISRGDVYFAELDPVRGREQSGRRPMIVVSSDLLNARDLVVTVAVGTDATNVPRRHPTTVLVPKSESGLPLDTVFLCHQLRSIDPQRFVDPKWNAARRMGRLPAARMAAIDAALRCALEL